MPASPARAASIVAFSASKFVWSAISPISLVTLSMLPTASARLFIVATVRSLMSTASLVPAVASPSWRSISPIEATISSVAAETAWVPAETCPATDPTAWALLFTRAAECHLVGVVGQLLRAVAHAGDRPTRFAFHRIGHRQRRRAALLLGSGAVLRLLCGALFVRASLGFFGLALPALFLQPRVLGQAALLFLLLLLAQASLFGFLLQALVLDARLLEHLHRLGHLADFVATTARRHLGRPVLAGQAPHRRRHRGQRPRRQRADQSPAVTVSTPRTASGPGSACVPR